MSIKQKIFLVTLDGSPAIRENLENSWFMYENKIKDMTIREFIQTTNNSGRGEFSVCIINKLFYKDNTELDLDDTLESVFNNISIGNHNDGDLQLICDVSSYICVGFGKGVLYVDTKTNKGFKPEQLFGNQGTTQIPTCTTEKNARGMCC